jgi:hypothetical protein
MIVCLFTSDSIAQGKKTKAKTTTQQSTQIIPPPKENKLIMNHFVSDPALSTHLVVTDVDGNGTTIKVEIYDKDGKLQYSKYEILSPFGKLNADPCDYVKQVPMEGTIRVTSQGGRIAGQYWQFYKSAEDFSQNVAIPAGDGIGFEHLVCQHFGSFPNIETFLVIANVGHDKPAVINIKYDTDAGSIVAMERQIIQPGGVVYIEPYKKLQKDMTGVVYIDTEDGAKVTGEYWERVQKQYQIALPVDGLAKERR